MDKQIKECWIAALESGVYPKGKSALMNDIGGFCCLGVLCDLYAKEHDAGWTSDGFGLTIEGTTKGPDSLVPDEVRAWAGIKDEETEIHAFLPKSLAVLNDSTDTFEPVIERIRGIG